MDLLSDPTWSRNWFFRYKLYHLLFWFVYHYLWWVVAIGSPTRVISNIFFSPYSTKFLCYLVFQAAGVYFNLYYLIPHFLEKGRYVAYIALLTLTIAGSAALIVAGYYAGAYWSGRPFEELYGIAADQYFHLFKANSLPSTVASMTLAMSIKLTKNWVQTNRRQQLLEKEKLETELKFLKYQFNPHFLFNTINSIFFLIHKNPHVASASLAKFSELLRYQLYECNDRQISLSKEITYLENFIELEKLRQNNNVEVSFRNSLPYTEHLGIAPFILMTFVENAFKHVSKHADQPNWITVQMDLHQQQLNFAVSNSTAPLATADVVSYGGLGLKNVQRRLDLLYPGQYNLAIQKTPERFEVQLKVTLSELVLAHPVPHLI